MIKQTIISNKNKSIVEENFKSMERLALNFKN